MHLSKLSQLEKHKYLWLHFIILLWGFTPVLGKLISLQAFDLVWWRLFISSLSLFAFIYFKQHSLHITLRDCIPVVIMGFIVGAHWFFFYHAIKVSNVSIALSGFSTITIFASVMQPIFLGKKFFWGDLVYGFIILLGLAFILHYEAFAFSGVLYGVLAALTGAAFGVYNGKLIVKHNSSVITLIEFLGAFFIISIAKLVDGDLQTFIPKLGMHDLIFLLVLSILCTTLAFTLGVEILKQFDPFTVIITNNLEPIYGVIFSLLIFGESEMMSTQFYLGALIILFSVFTYPFVKKRYYNG